MLEKVRPKSAAPDGHIVREAAHDTRPRILRPPASRNMRLNGETKSSKLREIELR